MYKCGLPAMSRILQNSNKLLTAYLYWAIDVFSMELFVRLFIKNTFCTCLYHSFWNFRKYSNNLIFATSLFGMVLQRVFCFCISKTFIEHLFPPVKMEKRSRAVRILKLKLNKIMLLEIYLINFRNCKVSAQQ